MENNIIIAVNEYTKTVKSCTLKQAGKIAAGPDCSYSLWIVNKAEYDALVKQGKDARLQSPGYFAFNRLHNGRKARRYY